MKRSDRGFVVSRVLSVWVLVQAVMSLRMSLQFLPYGLASDRRALGPELVNLGLLVALACILWFGAAKFGAEGSSETASPVDLPAFRSALLTMLGLYFSVQGVAVLTHYAAFRMAVGPNESLLSYTGPDAYSGLVMLLSGVVILLAANAKLWSKISNFARVDDSSDEPD